MMAGAGESTEGEYENRAEAPSVAAGRASSRPEAVSRQSAVRGWAEVPYRVACRADSLSAGVVALLGMTVLQRLVGFGRSLMFCRLLDEGELGHWSLGLSWLVLAAPLAVIGLPGSFGRYVEYYRQRGQLRAFLRRTVLVTGTTAGSLIAAMWLLPGRFGSLIFNDGETITTIRLLAASLAIVIFYNFLTELFTALRMARVVSRMRFTQSVLFAGVGVGLLCVTTLGENAVIIAYGLGALVSAVGGAVWLVQTVRDLPPDGELLPQSAMWGRLLPFAAWIWVTNLLSNLFEVTDRFMIVHFAPLEFGAAQSLVGQYQSSREIPALLVEVGCMLGSLLLPYLSHDWEAGNRAAVSARHNLSLKLLSLSFSAAGVGILLVTPFLFRTVLEGRYEMGLAAIPWTITYCIWFALILTTQNYLWCRENAKLGSLALLVGLLLNFGICRLLVPWIGMPGAVAATTVSKGVSLLLMLVFCWRQGLAFDRGLCLAALLPALVGLGGPIAALGVGAFLLIAATTNCVFSSQERELLVAQGYEQSQRLLGRISRRVVRHGAPAAAACRAAPGACPNVNPPRES